MRQRLANMAITDQAYITLDSGRAARQRLAHLITTLQTYMTWAPGPGRAVGQTHMAITPQAYITPALGPDRAARYRLSDTAVQRYIILGPGRATRQTQQMPGL